MSLVSDSQSSQPSKNLRFASDVNDDVQIDGKDQTPSVPNASPVFSFKSSHGLNKCFSSTSSPGSVNLFSIGGFDDMELFNTLAHDGDSENDEGFVAPRDFIEALANQGLSLDDSRLKLVKQNLQKFIDDGKEMNFGQFIGVVSSAQGLLERTLRNKGALLCIPEWVKFRDAVETIYNQTKESTYGQVTTSIPELEEVDPNLFGVAFCSCDGQRLSFGDDMAVFPVMSASKPINYLLALDEHGTDYVHRFVGREPSGQGFNKMVLNHKNIPHNPYVESGAIMITSLIKNNAEASARFGHIMGTWSRATAESSSLRFNNSIFLSDRDASDRNYCLGYMMQEKGAFQSGNDKTLPARNWKGRVDLANTLDLYSMCCAIEANVTDLACLAATLANGGVCPISGDRVFKSEYVRGALTLMLSCGMYDYSGKWAYSMGIPAKSGSSGIVMVVVPNLGGFAVYSPRLRKSGNSARAIEFYARLCKSMTLHVLEIAMAKSGERMFEEEEKSHESSLKKDEEDPLSEWSSEKVKIWIESVGSNFSQYGDSIIRNQITGIAIINSELWTSADLEALFGMSDPDHQRVVLSELEGMRSKHKAKLDRNKESFFLRPSTEPKLNPFRDPNEKKVFVGKIHFMAAAGDIAGIMASYAAGVDLDTPDYDMRTPLHLAAAEKQLEVCKYLVNKHVDVNAVDRMGGTPLSDAINIQSTEVVEYLKSRGAQLPIQLPMSPQPVPYRSRSTPHKSRSVSPPFVNNIAKKTTATTTTTDFSVTTATTTT